MASQYSYEMEQDRRHANQRNWTIVGVLVLILTGVGYYFGGEIQDSKYSYIDEQLNGMRGAGYAIRHPELHAAFKRDVRSAMEDGKITHYEYGWIFDNREERFKPYVEQLRKKLKEDLIRE